MPPLPKVRIEPSDLEECRGLDPVRKELALLARISRPVLVRGDANTVGALAPCLSPGHQVAEFFCGLLSAERDGLQELLARHRARLTRPGVLLLLGIDELRDADRLYLQTVARTGALDARGGALTCRLVCQMELDRSWPLDATGVFLDVVVPPLAARVDDAAAVLRRLLARYVGSEVSLDDAAREAAAAYAWPGGLNEVIMRVERLTAMRETDAPPTVSLEELGIPGGPPTPPREPQPTSVPGKAGSSFRAVMSSYEAEVIREALARHGGNKSQTAIELEVSRSWLIQKCKEFGFEVESRPPATGPEGDPPAGYRWRFQRMKGTR